MKDAINIGFLGGDTRQIELINSLSESNNVVSTGIDKAVSQIKALNLNIEEMLQKSDYIVLPIPITKDGLYFYTPFSEFKTPINGTLAMKMKNKKIFCYGAERLINICQKFENCKYYDLASHESFVLANAEITAKCAVEMAKKELNIPLKKAKILVCGFGRIGKFLTNILQPMGTDLTVSARKPDDLLKIKALKAKAALTTELKDCGEFDLIINTVPSLIFDEKLLKTITGKTVIIDLASMPGGIDKAAAEKLGIKAIHATGLPGKMAPLESAIAMKNIIYDILKEEME